MGVERVACILQGVENVYETDLLRPVIDVAETLTGAISREGATLVPLDIHFNDRGVAKLTLGLAEGKTKADKRQAIAERDWKRDKARVMRDNG